MTWSLVKLQFPLLVASQGIFVLSWGSPQSLCFLPMENAIIRAPVRIPTPVSYTHLDVYKRQQYIYIQLLSATVRFLMYIKYLKFIFILPQDVIFPLFGKCFENSCVLILSLCDLASGEVFVCGLGAILVSCWSLVF